MRRAQLLLVHALVGGGRVSNETDLKTSSESTAYAASKTRQGGFDPIGAFWGGLRAVSLCTSVAGPAFTRRHNFLVGFVIIEKCTEKKRRTAHVLSPDRQALTH